MRKPEIGEDFLRLDHHPAMADYLWPRVFCETHADGDVAYFPLMHFQETLYFHRKGFVQNEPSGLSCYIYLNARMDGDFRPDVFDKALNYVVGRHPIMRSVIDEEREKPRFKVFKTVPEVHARHIDVSHLPPSEERAYILQRGLELNDYRFDLGEWPLFFCEITKFANDRYVFAMNIDHMLVDGFSYMQVFDELFNTYDRMVLGEPWELPEAAMTFGDYVRVENLRQRTQEYKNALEFQLGLFKDLPSKALLPTKRNPALLKEVYFDTFYQEIRPEIIEGLNAIAAEEQISLNALAARGLLQADERVVPSGRHDHQHAGVQPRTVFRRGPQDRGQLHRHLPGTPADPLRRAHRPDRPQGRGVHPQAP